jgi:hypothetical protein
MSDLDNMSLEDAAETVEAGRLVAGLTLLQAGRRIKSEMERANRTEWERDRAIRAVRGLVAVSRDIRQHFAGTIIDNYPLALGEGRWRSLNAAITKAETVLS